MKILHTIFGFLRSFSSPHPLRDWLATLFIAALLLVGLFGVSLTLFFGVRSGTIIGAGASENTPLPRVSRLELERIVQIFETRRVNYESGNINTPDASDFSR